MSATLQRPAVPAPQPAHPAPTAPGASRDAHDPAGQRLVVWGTVVLLAATCLPYARVLVGWGFLRPVLTAVALSLAVSWACRRLGAGPALTLVVSATVWGLFVTLAYLPGSLGPVGLPTADTVREGVALWVRGVELVRLRPAPTFAEPPILLLLVTGAWAVTHAVDGLVFRARSPLQAVIVALIMWSVPLAMAPPGSALALWTVPLLAGTALLLLGFAGHDLARWGAWVSWDTDRNEGRTRPDNPLAPAGIPIAAAATVAGVLLAGLVPGAGERPWYDVRGLGATTLANNPIVNLRTNLVTTGGGPLLRVRASRPVYLRTTSLDLYSDQEEWTNRGIQGTPAGAALSLDFEPRARVEQVHVEVAVVGLTDAVLVPAPYQPFAVSGPAAAGMRYDDHLATLTTADGDSLVRGDRYRIDAVVPNPRPARLARVGTSELTGVNTTLPSTVPPEVGQLAAQTVREAGARNDFHRALAIQNELRSWTYSLDPPPGHSGQAMRSFLETRTGYCEQFAGTMAVMLRTLGIPARVAVGFTPGAYQPDQAEYVVTRSNAHAWVEVRFNDIGWVAFEPTPRGDGNVLVPDTNAIAPSEVVGVAPDPGIFRPGSFDDNINSGRASNTTPDAVTPQTGAAEAAGGPQVPWRGLLAAVAALALLLAGGFATAHLARRQGVPPDPAQRVLRARARVERTGRGLGIAPRRTDTDAEYLGRLAPGHAAVRRLADAAGRARYATVVDEHDATAAEHAARDLDETLLAGQPAHRRAAVRARGTVRAAVASAGRGRRGRRYRPALSPRSRLSSR